MTKEKAIYITLFFALAAQTAYYYPLLPETMASHFNFKGTANGWMAREMFFLLEYGVILMIYASMALSAWYMNRYPEKMNMMNKDYWPAPERRDETIAYFNAKMDHIGIAGSLFMLFVMQCVIETNINGGKVMMDQTTLFIGLAVFLGYMLIWTITLVVKFARIPSGGRQAR